MLFDSHISLRTQNKSQTIYACIFTIILFVNEFPKNRSSVIAREAQRPEAISANQKDLNK